MSAAGWGGGDPGADGGNSGVGGGGVGYSRRAVLGSLRPKRCAGVEMGGGEVGGG